MQGWNGWYHVNGNTYGTWLPGDPRGWRERWHRRHVEGDYKDPPPAGIHEDLHERSRSLLAGEAVRLNRRQRRVALEGIVEKLLERGIEVLGASVDAIHYHILARFADDRVRGPVGLAKKNASFLLGEHGLPGTVWARKCRALPVADRAHQLNVYRYILAHANKGACVWTFRDGIIEKNKAHG
jgi:hypothetical protein